jgi:four helix bundle protein
MKTYDVITFNQEMRSRTKIFAVDIYMALAKIKLDDLNRIPVKQLMKSATSVAANFSSATRGRSDAEFYSKICIVTEECDECLFWLNFLVETEIVRRSEVPLLQKESEELVRIFSSIKRKLKLKRMP